jgi:hypothetical protein
MSEIIIPDEASNPQAYRDALLALADTGGDPIEILSSTHAYIVQLTSGLSLETFHTPPAVGEWSAAVQMGHLLDAEIAYAFRWRLMVTEDRPAYPAYNVQIWAHLPKPPFPSLVEAFGVLRHLNLFLLQRLPDAWQRVGIHAEQGPETIEVSLRKLAGHDLAHRQQLKRTLETVTAADARTASRPVSDDPSRTHS